jgi:predicted CoA-binding protein
MEKTTLVLGASPNPDRYSFRAVKTLQKKNIPVIAIGKRDFDEDSLHIINGKPENIGPVHTVTLYLSAKNQIEYYDYVIMLHPKRVIFNPGTTNDEFAGMLRKENIEVVTDCMLALLACGQF